MSEFNVLDQLKRLVKLQEEDADFYNAKKELEEKPAFLKEALQEFESKKGRLNQLEADFKKIQVERSTLEGDLAQKEGKIAKGQAQLSQIKTNKEYTAKIGEIEGIKADQSLIEEKILETYDRADEIKALIDQEKEVVAKQEEEYNAKKQEIETELKELEAKVKELGTQRAVLLDGIDKNLLSRYEKILHNRNGQAVVPVIGDVCGGCFMNLPPQKVNEVRMHKELITCEICARILYIEEDVKGGEAEVPAEVVLEQVEEQVTETPSVTQDDSKEDDTKSETA